MAQSSRQGRRKEPDWFKGLQRTVELVTPLPIGDVYDAPYVEPLIRDIRYLGSYDQMEHDLIIVPGTPTTSFIVTSSQLR